MRFSLTANPIQARQTKQKFAKPDEQLSYELGKAVQELPPLYTRLLAGSISLIVVSAIGWAHFSQIDEVAVAKGELIASTQVRPITSLGSGTILKVKVKEGERVVKGQVLVERDPDLQRVDVVRLSKTAKLIKEDLQRLEAERNGGKKAGNQLQDELLASRLEDYQARQGAAEAETSRQVALTKQAKVRLTRLQENLVNAKSSLVSAKKNLSNSRTLQKNVETNLKLAQSREKGLRTLVSRGAITRLDYLDAQDRLNRAEAEITRAKDGVINAQNKVTEADDKVASLKKDIAAQLEEISQAEAAAESARKQLQRLKSERQSEILTKINKRKEELTTVQGRLEQARREKEGEKVKAPVPGMIYKIQATKGPVQTGEELLSILPDGEELLLEVKVLNRDIGFIREGMKAKVKMATFPFQEFGTIDGKVVQLSPNAVLDQDLGLVFPARIKLNKHHIMVKGRKVSLTPGMTASGEIVTRQKSVLTFIMEPVTRRFSEAFSVR